MFCMLMDLIFLLCVVVMVLRLLVVMIIFGYRGSFVLRKMVKGFVYIFLERMGL